MGDDKFRSRKFILILLVYAASTVMTGLKILDGTQIMSIYMALVGAYTLANVAEKKKLE